MYGRTLLFCNLQVMGQLIVPLVVRQIGISAHPSVQDVAITELLAHLKATNVIAVGAIVCAQNAH